MAERDIDITVFGATGFVGRLVARYLAEHAPQGVRVALAGRTPSKLEAVRSGLPSAARDWPLVIADSTDTASLTRLAETSRVVLTTVGPYAMSGLPLVQACARAGTHYADLAGEITFLRAVIDECDEPARASGARIVPTCGVDSIPSDLGVWDLAQRVAADGEDTLTDTTAVVTAFRGGIGGGTVDSALGQFRAGRTDRAVRRLLADPYSLSPDRGAEPDHGRQAELTRVVHDDLAGQYVGPFIMASINARIVRRSNALLDHAYGPRFRYREVTGLGDNQGRAIAKGLVTTGPPALLLLAGNKRIGAQAEAVLRRLLPKPGQGPSEKTQQAGETGFEIHARTSTGAHYVETVHIDGDPGFLATALLLSQAGLSLALDQDRLPDRAGVLTPATALDGALVDRLRSAGVTLNNRRMT
jgi:short subunit dehydrogenase-like uncharacterized protein